MAKLVIDDRGYGFMIVWQLEDDFGACLGEGTLTDYKADPPSDRGDWEHWAATRSIMEMPRASWGYSGMVFASLKDAQAALRVAKSALKQERPLPEWAQTALAAGWKAPKGWKA